jgi:hypothetical protein
MSTNKTPRQSKKFVAFLLADVGWKVALVLMLLSFRESMTSYAFGLMLTVVIVSGFIQVGYILGQAALDKYIYLAEKTITDRKDNDV